MSMRQVEGVAGTLSPYYAMAQPLVRSWSPTLYTKKKNLITNHTQGGRGIQCQIPGGWRRPISMNGFSYQQQADMRKTGPVILFIDGHKSHDSLKPNRAG